MDCADRAGRRCTVADPPPLAGRSLAEALATSAGGVGAHIRSLLPALAAAGAEVRVCGAPATEELFGFTAAGADFRPVGISAGLAPLADARAVLAMRAATAGADLVHAHGLRAGLVAAGARRPPPPRPPPGPGAGPGPRAPPPARPQPPADRAHPAQRVAGGDRSQAAA